MLIGELAKQAGLNRETLRYYERVGLVTPSERNESGYRLYDRAAAARLRFVRQAQQMGFSLSEIRDLLAVQGGSGRRACRRVLGLIEPKLDELDRQLAKMKQFRRELADYRDECRQAFDSGGECPVLAKASRDSE